MVHTRSNPRLCKSYIWNLARGVNGNRIFLSKFFIVFHYFRNVSKERLRRRPLWREVARTKVKKTTFVFCKLFHTQSSSLDSVYFVSFQAYSTLCGVKFYVLLDPFCTVFLTIVFDFPMIFSQNGHPNTKSKSLAKPQNVQEDSAIHIDKIYCSKGVMQFTRKYRLLQVMSIKKRRKDWFQLLLLCKLKSHPQRSLVCHMILGQIRK